MPTDPVRAARARIALYSRADRSNPAEVEAARRALSAAHVERQIRRSLSEPYAPTRDACLRLAKLLVDGVA